MDYVYIVSKGEKNDNNPYFDYHIVAAFSSEDEAKAFIQEASGVPDSDESRVERHPLDIPSTQWWAITLTMTKGGAVTSCPEPELMDDVPWETPEMLLGFNSAVEMLYRVSTKDPAHAVQAADHARARIVAMDLWPAEGGSFYDRMQAGHAGRAVLDQQ